MDEQREVVDLGGTMRLGDLPGASSSPARTSPTLYGEELVYERHRHRYEVNNRYRARLEEAGLACQGTSPDGRLVEFIELDRAGTRSGSRPRPIPSSRAGPTGPIRCSPRSCAPPLERAEGRAPRLPIVTAELAAS